MNNTDSILSKLTPEQIQYLRSIRLCVATPHHNGDVKFCYMMGLIDLNEWFLMNAQRICLIQEVGDSLITRARMCILRSFMDSGCTHLMMIDNDIKFTTEDVIKLLLERVDIIGAVYPKKNTFWNRLDEYIRGDKKLPEGYNLTARDIATEYVFTPVNKGEETENRLEAHDVGTGFMLVSMNCINHMIETADFFISDVTNSGYYGQKIPNLFDVEIEPGTKRYLSEDYAFCRRAQRLGIKTYIHKNINIGHYGSALYEADFASRFKK
jgi:hypothetical protein